MSKPTMGLRFKDTRIEFDECQMRVSADGYVKVITPQGWKFRELILTFPEIEAALQEERDLWQ